MITLGTTSEDVFRGGPADLPSSWGFSSMSGDVMIGAAVCFAFMYLAARLGTDWRAWLARSGLALVLTMFLVEGTGNTYYASRYSGFEWVRFHMGFAAVAYFTVAAVEICGRLLWSRIRNG